MILYIRSSTRELYIIHGNPRANTVASLHGAGNATVAKNGCFPLSNIGDVQAEIKFGDGQATTIIIAAYSNAGDSPAVKQLFWPLPKIL